MSDEAAPAMFVVFIMLPKVARMRKRRWGGWRGRGKVLISVIAEASETEKGK